MTLSHWLITNISLDITSKHHCHWQNILRSISKLIFICSCVHPDSWYVQRFPKMCANVVQQLVDLVMWACILVRLKIAPPPSPPLSHSLLQKKLLPQCQCPSQAPPCKLDSSHSWVLNTIKTANIIIEVVLAMAMAMVGLRWACKCHLRWQRIQR